jgi:hypothetical protein
MSYFRNFPTANYKFGNSEKAVNFQQLSVFSDVIDDIKDNVTVYEEYTILENMRPDQISQEIYGTTEYYWTFYLLNDNIREQGWPLSQSELLAQAKKDYPDTVLTTSTNLVQDLFTATGQTREKILPGSTITGQSSGVSGKIINRNLDLGHVTVKGKVSFNAGETALLSTDTNVSFVINSVVDEHLATHHFEDGDGNYVDIVSDSGVVDLTGASNTKITNLDNYVRVNNSLKEIRIFKAGVVQQVTDAIQSAIRS